MLLRREQVAAAEKVPPPCSGRQDRLVEARRRASHRVCPHCWWIVRWTWVTARTAGVSAVDVPVMGAAVVPVVKPLEGHGGLQMSFCCCRLLICRGWIASAGVVGSVSARRTTTAALLLLRCVGGGGLLLLQGHAELMHSLELPLHCCDC
jgi:hypothetical protein